LDNLYILLYLICNFTKLSSTKNSEKLRLYRNLVDASIEALQKIFSENQLADRIVQALLRSNKKWGSKDRRFLASTIYDTVRWYRLYYEVYGKEPESKSDWWNVLGGMWICQGNELPKWREFETLEPEAIKEKYQELLQIRKMKASIPDWMDELGEQELGEKWDECLTASNEPAALVLRANTLKTSREDLVKELHKKGIQTELIDLPDAVVIPERKKLTNMPSYERGYFEIQDASSKQVVPYLDIQKGLYVVDACAGAGGKSLHMAALMNNTGRILSLDIGKAKLEELQKRAKRAAISTLKIQVIKSNNSLKQLHDLADRLLLDVPCSGLGTLRRSPGIKWRLTPKKLNRIREKQQQILRDYSPICKAGGKMVYATCSILPSENQEQVQAFLKTKAGAEFTLIKEQQILPQDEGYDGFYMALLEKKGTILGQW